MAAGRIIVPNYMPALDLNGAPLSGAKIYFFQNETTTLQSVYTDEGLATPHPNPVVADAAGVFPSIFADLAAAYSVSIRDAQDVPVGGLRDVDGVQAAESVNIKEDRLDGLYRSRVVASAAANATVVLQAELNAGYSHIILPAGTIWLDALTIPSGVTLEGQGKGRTILKRRATATANTFISAPTGQSRFALKNLTVDGNKANCTVAATNIVILAGCYDFELSHVDSRNALAVGGSYGGSMTILDTADHVHGTWSSVTECEAHDCGTYGLSAYRVRNFSFFRCRASGNVNNAGINIDNFDLPVPSSPVNVNVSISECSSWDNGIGIVLFGFRSASTPLGDVASQDHFQTCAIRITNNTTFDNTGYGLAIQADGAVVAGNTVYRNGSDTTNGGVLFNSRRSILSGNVITESWFYGIDAGGARSCEISDNVIALCGAYDAGAGMANQCIALNVGASIGVHVHGNRFSANGGTGSAGGAYNILASGYDGSNSANWMRWRGRDLTINDNKFELTDADHVAIKLSNGFQAGVEIYDNTAFCEGVTPVQVFDFSVDGAGFVQRNNRVRTAGETFGQTFASGTTAVVPDFGEMFLVSGTTTISTLKTRAASYWMDKVRYIPMTAGGAGYTSAPTVSFSGGGGSGAAGDAVIGADGVIYGVYITNPGSGYTAAPTVAFSGGGGSGAAATANIGCNNAEDRVITLKFQDAVVVSSGVGNIYLSAGFTSSAFGLSTLTLRGAFGNWYEVSRSV